MGCPHNGFNGGTCNNCRAWGQRHDAVNRDRERFYEKRDAKFEGIRDAARIRAKGEAAKNAKWAARERQPFLMFWWERVVVIAIVAVAALCVLAEILRAVFPLVLVMSVAGVAVWYYRRSRGSFQHAQSSTIGGASSRMDGHVDATPPPTAPAGWYLDPSDATGNHRWYDGDRWTEAVQSADHRTMP